MIGSSEWVVATLKRLYGADDYFAEWVDAACDRDNVTAHLVLRVQNNESLTLIHALNKIENTSLRVIATHRLGGDFIGCIELDVQDTAKVESYKYAAYRAPRVETDDSDDIPF